MKKLYCLFTITHGTYYTTIQGCEATDDYAMLENLRGWIAMIKKPNPSLTIEILETNSNCVLTKEGQEKLCKVRTQLA